MKPANAHPQMSETRTAVLGAFIVVLGPISLSLYTPALPVLVQAFDTTPSVMKLTLSVFFCGFALSQLVCGPLSDAFGRRPAAIGFFSLYMIGSAVAAFAPDVTWLIIGRGLQGMGAAAGPAISRALVRDQFTGQASARILNLIGTMLAIGPALAPTIGGVMLGLFGWHSLFALMLAYGVGALLLLLFLVPETNPAPDPRQAHPVQMLRNYGALLTNSGFMRVSLMIGFTLGGIYTLAAILPFVLIEMIHLTPTQFGFAMICQTGSFMAGTIAVGQLMRRVDASRLIPVGLGLVLLGGAGLAAMPFYGPTLFIEVMAPVALWAFGIALILPGATTAALADFPTMAGSAAALMGCFQIGGGFLGSAVASLFPAPLWALGAVLPGMGLLGALAFLLLKPNPQVAAPLPAEEAEADLELAADPAALLGAAGDEIEAKLFRKSA